MLWPSAGDGCGRSFVAEGEDTPKGSSSFRRPPSPRLLSGSMRIEIKVQHVWRAGGRVKLTRVGVSSHRSGDFTRPRRLPAARHVRCVAQSSSESCVLWPSAGDGGGRSFVAEGEDTPKGSSSFRRPPSPRFVGAPRGLRTSSNPRRPPELISAERAKTVKIPMIPAINIFL